MNIFSGKPGWIAIGLKCWELFPSTQLNQIQIQIKRVAREFHKQKPGLLKRLRKENQRTSSVLDLNRDKQKIGNWKIGLDYIFIYVFVKLSWNFWQAETPQFTLTAMNPLVISWRNGQEGLADEWDVTGLFRQVTHRPKRRQGDRAG